MKNNDFLQQLMTDAKLRRKITSESFYWFFHVYFSSYIKYQTADFQRELMQIIQNPLIKRLGVVAFRGSAKSTILSLAYPIWASIGIQAKKMILIIGQTQSQSEQMLRNIKRELESNELLARDFGPFNFNGTLWRSDLLQLQQTDTQIMALSTGGSIRGLRHGEFRPDLIICDDIEDLQSVKTHELRKKNFDWLMGDVIPAGAEDTRLIVIGNLLHQDSLLMKLEEIFKHDERAEFLRFPIMDGAGIPLWQGRFPDTDAINALKAQVDLSSWQREYCLIIVPDEDCVVEPEWIHYYDPEFGYQSQEKYVHTAVAVDLAISMKNTADYTAIVVADIYGYEEKRKIVIRPFPVNKRMKFPEAIETLKRIYDDIKAENKIVRVCIESIAFQEAVAQELGHQGYTVNPVVVQGDKKSRLAQTSGLVQSGRILFPSKGVDTLIQQLIGFPAEKHDDLVDAFSMLVLDDMKENRHQPRVFFLALGPRHSDEYGWRDLSYWR